MKDHDRDDELEALLDPGRNIKPSPAQWSRWRGAVHERLASANSIIMVLQNRWLQFAAAASLGFVLGYQWSQSPNVSRQKTKSLDLSATNYSVHSNLP